jgi:predicted AAA+ superfamily ATPase
MIARALTAVAFGEQWGRQMRFICGPRQAGKTTLARQWLEARNSQRLYYLWDLRSVRNRYKANELFFTADAPGAVDAWVCFDEVHKMPKWKNILKAVFDAVGERYRFVVTGSAKLNLLKRAGDSLAGRYFTFHLFPLMLSELAGRADVQDIPEAAVGFVERRLAAEPVGQGALDSLLAYGGFPEPFLRQTRTFYAKWGADYIETVVREDIGSLTRIVDREHIHDLYALLPEAVGSPVSEASLAGHLQVSPVTAKNYLRRLEDFYLGFSVAPYARNIKRSLLKARKFYLFDWARIKDTGKRFEDFVACQLKAMVSLWADASGTPFDLFYVRNKQKQETDFLIVRDGVPWLLIEAKLADGHVERHHETASMALGGIPIVQVCLESGIAAMQSKGVFRLSADQFLG